MTHKTVAAAVAGAPLALDQMAAADLLASALPGAGSAPVPMAAPPGFAVQPGERFAVAGGVAVVPVVGLLTNDNAAYERYFGWATYTGLMAAADTLAADDGVAAVCLHVNSPGGVTIGLEGALAALSDLAAVKPVYAIAAPLALSAAYWLAAGCGAALSITPGGMVGSVGVRMDLVQPVGPGLDGQQVVRVLSSKARAKAPDPLSEAGRALIQADLDGQEARFLAAIAKGRGIAPDDLPGRLSVTDRPEDGGAAFWPDQAQERGLVDRVETVAAFYGRVIAAHGREAKPKPGGGAGVRRALSDRGAVAQALAAAAAARARV